jgi:hypothetical protein
MPHLPKEKAISRAGRAIGCAADLVRWKLFIPNLFNVHRFQSVFKSQGNLELQTGTAFVIGIRRAATSPICAPICDL